jgi:RNA polymerase sigma-70 factor (ECF subfamily)
MTSLPSPIAFAEPVDPARFALLYLEQSGVVLRFLHGIMRDRAEAEDVLHEVFLKAYRALSSDDPPDLESGWLFTVARTTAIDHLRRGSRNQPVAPAGIVDLADRRRASEREPNRHWISEPEVREMLARLPERQQEIIVLRYVMGCTHADIARILEMSEPAVRKAHQRSLQALAQALASSELASVRSRNRYAMGAVHMPRRMALAGFSLLWRQRRWT